MSSIFKVVISPTEISAIDSAEARNLLYSIDKLSVSRLSHVEPVNFLLKSLFHACRKYFGDYSAVSNWLCTWHCQWRVDFSLSLGPCYYRGYDNKIWKDRKEALLFEAAVAQYFLETGVWYASTS